MTLCLPVVLQQRGAALVLSQQLHAAPLADCQRHHAADAVAAAGAVALQHEEQLMDWQMLCHGLALQSRSDENKPWMMGRRAWQSVLWTVGAACCRGYASRL